MRLCNLAILAVTTTWLVMSCSDTESTSDAGSDGDVTDTRTDDSPLDDVAMALTPPEPPVLVPCPSGWTEVAFGNHDGVSLCEPWPDGAPQVCETHQFQLPGEAECTTIGPECPEGEWADNLPSEGSVLYVSAGAPSGGVGTPEDPFGTIGDAIGAATSGTVIALGKGTYDEVVALPDGVSLWGACVAQTIVTSSEPSAIEAVITAVDGTIGIQQLQISGSRLGVLVGAGSNLTLRDAVISDTREAALTLTDGAIGSVAGAAFRNTTSEAGPMGAGIRLSSGTQLRSSRIAVEGNLGMGIFVEGSDTVFMMERSVVRETVLEEGEYLIPMGSGLMAAEASVEIVASLFECPTFANIVALGEGTSITINDAVARVSPPGASCADTPGILTIDDEPVAHPDGDRGGFGIFGAEGAEVTATRLLLDGSRPSGAAVVNAGRLELTDAVIRGTETMSTQSLAAGLFVFRLGPLLAPEEKSGDLEVHQSSLQSGPSATLTRVIFDGNDGTAIIVTGEGASVEASDTVIVDTAPLDCETHDCPEGSEGFGIGVTATDSASTSLTRFEVSGSNLCGLQLARDGAVDLTDGLVARNPVGVNIQSQPFDVDRLTDRVRYEDNGRNLDSSTLPVPDPSLVLP